MSFDWLREAAFKKWAPKGTWGKPVPLAAGFSGAEIFSVKLQIPGDGARVPVGQYVLKLAKRETTVGRAEKDVHDEAVKTINQIDKNFCNKHTAQLIDCYEKTEDGKHYSAMLMGIGGRSFDRFGPANRPEDGLFKSRVRSLTKTTLQSWSFSNLTPDLFPHQLLEEWLGRRLDQGSPLDQLVQETMNDSRKLVCGTEVLVNPLWFYRFLANNQDSCASQGVIKGLLHGDFHGGNILIPKKEEYRDPFSIIDFALAHPGPMGYDQSYLEVFLCLINLGKDEKKSSKSLIRVLEWMEKDELGNNASLVETYLFGILKEIRDGWKEWQQEKFPNLVDDLERQYLLSRVAAGINWANKNLDNDNQRELALYYAGFAAKKFLETRQENLYELWESDQPEPHLHNDTTKSISYVDFKQKAIMNPHAPFSEPLTGMELVWIPSGQFMMGSPEDEEERLKREGPQHLVELATQKNPICNIITNGYRVLRGGCLLNKASGLRSAERGQNPPGHQANVFGFRLVRLPQD